MDQVTVIHQVEYFQAMIDVMKRYNRPCEIDWVNRTIEVLSPVITHPRVILSDGPMTYRDRLFSMPTK